MYDAIVDDNTTLTAAAQRAKEERRYAELGREVATQGQMQNYAAPIAEQAWAEGQAAGVEGLLQMIHAKRAAQQEAVLRPEGLQTPGLADYFERQEEQY